MLLSVLWVGLKNKSAKSGSRDSDSFLSRRLFSKTETCAMYAPTTFPSLTMTRFQNRARSAGSIEEFHRGIKQTTGIEKCYSIKKRSQLTHIFSCFVAFVTLEFERLKTGVSWYEQKRGLSELG